jgi:transmembrane sensor
MNAPKMTVEDLLADESFINYCKNSSPEDVAFWETYTLENPADQLLIKNAKATFIDLFNTLAMNDLDEQATLLVTRLNRVEAPIVQLQERVEKKSKNIFYLLKISAAVAAVVAVVLLAVNFYSGSNPNKEGHRTFMAAFGERKDFQLPDGSVVTLNGGSKLEIGEGFGVASRYLYLEGEAFFDVKHNAALPFIVHTPAMDVKALGTAFNVKAYPGEKITETSLLRGLVEVTLNENNNRKMLLHPNQKVHWEHGSINGGVTNSSNIKKGHKINDADSLMQKLITNEDGDIKEIAWKENKLIFEDDSFEDIALLLERWYGVKILISDEAIRSYRFTGLFEKEELGTVLNLLKESRNFNYEIEPGKTLQVNITR